MATSDFTTSYDLVAHPTNAPLTMTSREIADLMEKRHDNILRDIDNILISLENSELSSGFKSSTYVSGDPPRHYREFLLDRDSVYCLIAGYDANARMRIIKRWQELEAQATTPVIKSMTTNQLLLMAAQGLIEQEQRTAELEHRVERIDQTVKEKLMETEDRITALEAVPVNTQGSEINIIKMPKMYGLMSMLAIGTYIQIHRPWLIAKYSGNRAMQGLGRTVKTIVKREFPQQKTTYTSNNASLYPLWVLKEIFNKIIDREHNDDH